MNQITFPYGGGKKERANFYGMFGQNLPISPAFTDIENEATTVQRNRCVHTLSQTQHWPASDVTKRGYKNKWRCVVLKKKQPIESK